MPQKESVATDKAPPPCLSSPKQLNDKEWFTALRQALLNLQAVLEAAGSSIDSVLKVNEFLTKMEDFAAINKVYAEFFHKDPKSVRTCVAVHELPLGTDVEIQCTAHQGYFVVVD